MAAGRAPVQALAATTASTCIAGTPRTARASLPAQAVESVYPGCLDLAAPEREALNLARATAAAAAAAASSGESSPRSSGGGTPPPDWLPELSGAISM
jgi:hypothetical protein